MIRYVLLQILDRLVHFDFINTYLYTEAAKRNMSFMFNSHFVSNGFTSWKLTGKARLFPREIVNPAPPPNCQRIFMPDSMDCSIGANVNNFKVTCFKKLAFAYRSICLRRREKNWKRLLNDKKRKGVHEIIKDDGRTKKTVSGTPMNGKVCCVEKRCHNTESESKPPTRPRSTLRTANTLDRRRLHGN